MCIKVVESTFPLTMSNHPPRYLVLKNVMGKENVTKQFKFIVIFLTNKRLQEKFGTCNTFCKVRGMMKAIP